MTEIGLTVQEVAEVERTWNLVATNLKQHGVSLFMTLFTHYPHIKGFFKRFDGIEMKDLAKHPRLKAHGSSFMHGLASLMDNLDDKETLVAVTKDTIVRHIKRNVGIEEYVPVISVLHIYLKEALGTELTAEGTSGWQKITDTFLAIAKETLLAHEEKSHENGEVNSQLQDQKGTNQMQNQEERLQNNDEKNEMRDQKVTSQNHEEENQLQNHEDKEQLQNHED